MSLWSVSLILHCDINFKAANIKKNKKTTHLTHLEPALNVNLFVHRRQSTLQKGGSDPFQHAEVFPWTAWTLAIYQTAVELGACLLRPSF